MSRICNSVIVAHNVLLRLMSCDVSFLQDTDERFDSIYPNLKELAFPDFNANPNKIVAGETDDVNVPQRKELWSDSTDDHETSEDDDERKVEEVKEKKKKVKAKVTMDEKIDASDMAAFPAKTSVRHLITCLYYCKSPTSYYLLVLFGVK